MKLVIPLLLALALLPISAFAEGGAATPEEGEDWTDAYIKNYHKHNPPVIYFDKKSREEAAKEGAEIKVAPDAPSELGIVPPLTLKGQDSPILNRHQRLMKEEKEKGPWHKRHIKSLGIPLEKKYIFELPLPNNADIEELRKDILEYSGINVKVDNPKLTWKYLGEKDVDGTKKHVWVTALHAKGASYIILYADKTPNCRDPYCNIYVYGNVLHEGRPFVSDMMRSHWDTARADGETAYIEYHSKSWDRRPDASPPFTFSRYSYGFP